MRRVRGSVEKLSTYVFLESEQFNQIDFFTRWRPKGDTGGNRDRYQLQNVTRTVTIDVYIARLFCFSCKITEPSSGTSARRSFACSCVPCSFPCAPNTFLERSRPAEVSARRCARIVCPSWRRSGWRGRQNSTAPGEILKRERCISNAGNRRKSEF